MTTRDDAGANVSSGSRLLYRSRPRFIHPRIVPAMLAACGLASPPLAGSPSVLELDSPPGIMVGVGSHQLHIHCTGRGSPVVVFESGLGGTSLDWSKVQPAVSAFTRACSYDRAGYGWSEPGPRPRHAVRLAAELDRLLTYADVPPPYVLVGHSFGGLAIRMFAARREHTVAGLVLVDAVHERQFQHMKAAGVQTPTAPTGNRFVIVNPGIMPDGLPGSAEARSTAPRHLAQGGASSLR